MHPKSIKIADYTYQLPEARIAAQPHEERDASQLLVYRDGLITDDLFVNMAQHVPPGTLMVFNETRVIYARLLFPRRLGTPIEIFCLEPAGAIPDIQHAMVQKGTVQWQCLVGGAKKWKEGLELHVNIPEHDLRLSAQMVEKLDGRFIIAFSSNKPEMTFAELLHVAGKIPLPPYIKRAANTTDAERYQTVYARNEGSVAAPTAGLHFTDRVMASLTTKSVDKGFVTLHVGAGTFMPVKSELLADHPMHAEFIEVNRTMVEQLIGHIGNDIVAVGTTSLRTIESLYHIGNKLLQGITVNWEGNAVDQWDPYDIPASSDVKHALEAIVNHMDLVGTDELITKTQILMAPGYSFKIATGLVTNFHQPGSTLLLLVAAFIGNDWKLVYEHAMNHNYRFLSYGDGSLLWKTGK